MLQKIENYHHALAQLAEAVQIYTQDPNDSLYRDGLIQRFEFTVELAWKSLKEYLEDQGTILGIASPRGVLKEAYAAGAIMDAETWNHIIEARNITSHVYDEKTAQAVAGQIAREFLPVLQKLDDFYRG
ncbi:MAG: nucleotidyltransferase substrate binding protein [Blautia massiliensis (ex Durand et al. 2017)]